MARGPGFAAPRRNRARDRTRRPDKATAHQTPDRELGSQPLNPPAPSERRNPGRLPEGIDGSGVFADQCKPALRRMSTTYRDNLVKRLTPERLGSYLAEAGGSVPAAISLYEPPPADCNPGRLPEGIDGSGVFTDQCKPALR